MAERMGANGLPIIKKIVTWEEHQAQGSSEVLQEILEINPNSAPEVVEETVEEVDEVVVEKGKKWK